MQPDIKRLVDLQAVDLRLADLRAGLNTFPQQLSEVDKRIADARQQLAAAKESLLNSVKDRKKYEMDVDSWKEKARKYREQGAAVKTNEAYKALQHEILHAEGEVAQAEDRLLERMVAGEEFERQVKAAERAIVEVERSAANDLREIEAKQGALQKELEEKKTERLQAAAAVPENLLDQYEHVAKHHHGIGLAEVLHQACMRCGVMIRPHVLQELRRDDCHEIFQCETCTRILYYIEPPPAPADAAAPAGAPASEG